MPIKPTCEECGAELPANAPQGLCPRCLANMGLSLVPPAGVRIKPRTAYYNSERCRQIGDYTLLEEIARGGMGVVYKARQEKLDRLVAVKMILAGEFASREQAMRFRAEVEAAARLQHPNIIRIHETGEQDGQPYFSMDYVEGPNLAMLVREKPLPVKRAVGYVQTIAEAIHYAHEQGILHRDLKPSNVLIDSNDQPHVTDFGLAKRMQRESFLTVTGDVMGSPNFMPPEQAGAKDVKVGRYSDVYSLGGILFFLVTGRPPFVGETIAATMHQVLTSEPISPRLLNASLPQDIATICLKCLEKETKRRYSTGQELAEDLGRWLRHEPIRARPTSQWERVLKWVKRKPLIAGLATVVLLLLTALGASSTIAAMRIERARRQTTERLYESYLAQARANRLSGRPGRRFDSLEALRKAVAIRPSPELRDEAIAAFALLDLRVAREWEMLEPTEPDSIHFDPKLERYAVKTPEGNIAICQVKDDQPLSLVPCHDRGLYWLLDFSPDGRYLVMATRTAPACVWDITRNEWAFENLPGFMCFDPTGARLAYADADGAICLYELDTRREIRRIEMNAASSPGHFDPGGSRFACFDRQSPYLEVWDWETLKLSVKVPIPEQCDAIAWSADGRFLAIGCSDNCAYVLDAQSGRRIAVLQGHQMRVTRVAFNHAGTLLATTGWDGTIRLWDPKRGLPLLVFPDTGSSQLQFSVDDHYLAYFTASSRKFGLLEIAASPVYRRLPISDPHGDVAGLDLSPDGRLIMAGGRERICFLDFSSGREIGFLARGRCDSILFHPDGKSFLTSGYFGLARWPFERIPHGQAEEIRVGSPAPMHADASDHSLRFACQSTDGRMVAAIAGSGPGALVFSAHRPGSFTSLTHLGAAFVTISPDGKRVATGTWKRTDVKIWETSTGQLEHTLVLPDSEKVLFSPDGQWLITAGGEDYRLWEVGSWRQRFSLSAGLFGAKFASMAFSPDSRLLAVGPTSDNIRFLESATGRPIARIEAPDRFLLSRICFSRDGSQLLALDTVNNVHIWDLRSLRQLLKSMNLDWDLPPYPAEDHEQRFEPTESK